MREISRHLDICIGTCCCHIPCHGAAGVILIHNQQTTCTLNRQNAVKHDLAIFSCGMIGIIITSSKINYSGNKRQIRKGDICVGCVNGVVVTGAAPVITQ